MISRLAAKPSSLGFLIVVQSLCAAFFLGDVIGDIRADGLSALMGGHDAIEVAFVLVLLLTFAFELVLLGDLVRRGAHLERQVSIASGAFHDIIEAHFRDWGLTPAEQDIAHFLIKGCDIPEIARLRGSAEGTVKSHLNAIYRKAGVAGRPGLLSLLIEDLMGSKVLPDAPVEAERKETAHP